MTPDRERDLERICQAALERSATDRARFLVEACGGDAVLRSEVESLLAQTGAASSFLETPVLAAAAQAMGAAGSALAVGQQIGPYTIRSPLGSGGMGEVYRARDATLGREVAIKVLPSLFTSDSERLRRFEREARLLASLNHPNIATIHGVETVDGVHALVLELVEGEGLDERLRDNRAGLPLGEALMIARQIAEALEAAHDKGVIHRDLKPANIRIRPDGVVKVLDFGLAKAVAPADSPADGSQLPTRTVGTQAGAILGTATYMSPEQARGQAVDTRTDIWAFGCVLYEMLTGSRVFAGHTSAESLAEVLKTDPDWSRLPAQTPENIRRLLDRCLRKERSRRLKDVADARLEIDDLSLSVRPPDRVSLKRGERAMWAAAVATLLVASFAIVALNRPLGEPERRLELNLPPRTSAFALSPDGLTVTFVAPSEGQSRLWVRPLDTLTANALAGTEGARLPFWSPDGRSIGFATETQLKRVSLDDGSVLTITAGALFAGGARRGIATTRFSIPRVQGHRSGAFLSREVNRSPPRDSKPSSGGTSARTSFPISATFCSSWMAHPTRVASTSVRWGTNRVAALSMPTALPPLRQRPGTCSSCEGKLLAQAFDAGRLELSGNPLVIDEHVTAGTALTLTASVAGPFAYRKPPPDGGQRQLTWVSREGGSCRGSSTPTRWHWARPCRTTVVASRCSASRTATQTSGRMPSSGALGIV